MIEPFERSVVPVRPSVGYGHAAEARDRYVFVGYIGKIRPYGRVWEIVIAGAKADEDYEAFTVSEADGSVLKAIQDFQVEWAPPRLQNAARRELFPGLRIDHPIQRDSGWPESDDEPASSKSGSLSGPWARFGG
jgi:hypothetical protein